MLTLLLLSSGKTNRQERRGKTQIMYINTNIQNSLPSNQLHLLAHPPAFKQPAITTVVIASMLNREENKKKEKEPPKEQHPKIKLKVNSQYLALSVCCAVKHILPVPLLSTACHTIYYTSLICLLANAKYMGGRWGGVMPTTKQQMVK